MRSHLGSPASQSISYPSYSSYSSSSTYQCCGWEGFQEVEAAAVVVVATAGMEEAAAAVVLGTGMGACMVAVVEEDVGRRLSRRLLTYLLTCLGNRYPSPRLSRHLRDRHDSCQGLSSLGSRSRATPWTSCGSQPSSRSRLQVKSLPK
jgi:hypothetical protein